MKVLDCTKIRIVLVGFVAAIVLCGGSAKADFTFGEPVNLGPTVNNSSSYDYFPCPSADGLELFFVSDRPGGEGAEDLWVTTRTSVAEPWGDPINLGPTVNTSSTETGPTLSADGLELYFSAYTEDAFDILMTTRPTRNSAWGEPVSLGSFFYVDSETLVVCPSLSGDGLELYVAMGHAEPVHEWSVGVARRDSRDAPWQAPVRLGPQINSWSCQGHPGISSDGLLLVFSDIWACSPRPGGLGGTDLWLARRATRDGEWGTAINLGAPVNTAFGEDFAKISPDGSTLYFTTYHHTATGEIDWATGDLYQAPIIPIVDFNADGIVDAADMCIMVDYWGTDEPLCDIGPMPWGDGVVDVEDLIVLAEHLFEDFALVAHWELDEEMGNIAYDSVGEYDGTVHGEPLWQPTEGKIDGALQFDGVDDYVSIPFVLNPTDGDFSVVAWLMGDVPGQIVLSQVSQAGRGNWLCTDSVEGCLMTELKGSGRPSSGPLLSEAKITDGTWHRIGLVWDGSYRRLYVDGAEVAKDAAPLSSLEDAYGGLYFGAGSDLSAGTFFSGLIDDVRIYNRVIEP